MVLHVSWHSCANEAENDSATQDDLQETLVGTGNEMVVRAYFGESWEDGVGDHPCGSAR